MLRAPVVVLCAAFLLAACGDDGPGAAEPARAPALSAAPAGTVHRVGTGPEGIVYDATTGTLAVAIRHPTELLLLDGRTLAVRRTVPLPGKARHLQLAGPGGPVLVPDETSDSLIEVGLRAATVRTTKVGDHPHDAAAVSGGVIAVGDEHGGALSFVRSGRVVATVTGLRQPGGVIGDGDTLAVLDVGRFTLSTYDAVTHRRIAVLPAGRGPTHGVLLGGRRVAVCDTRGNAVSVYSLDPLRRLGTLSLPGTPYGIAADGNTVWVTLTARNQLVGLDVSGATPRVVARYATARQPDTVAVAPGGHRLWVTGTADGVVESITR